MAGKDVLFKQLKSVLKARRRSSQCLFKQTTAFAKIPKSIGVQIRIRRGEMTRMLCRRKKQNKNTMAFMQGRRNNRYIMYSGEEHTERIQRLRVFLVL